ncbi:MAG TPA: nuclear transport factor 2 family protein [Candidatus Acidoferrum sp.]|jgi:N-methylhydantoinase A/oxoprolinase/acetone carboxylase beta subunit|nr:nuclear transport factor 2 family protein [Candidatus Acidoferrum sp.]
MIKFAGIAAVATMLLLAEGPPQQDERAAAERNDCIRRCLTQPLDPELRRQEIVSLEKEAGHAIALRNGSFFRRVYSEDFAGTLSRGQQVDKAQWIALIQSDAVKYESFNASDIKVQIYQEMAVATCLWSSRFSAKGQRLSHQMRAIHVYLNGASGWHVVSGQITGLPPDVGQPL